MVTIFPIGPKSPIAIRLIRLDGSIIRLEAELVTECGRCPTCGMNSTKVHARYVRRPLDLPWRGHPVRLELTVRRFRCLNPACERKTFAEDGGPDLPHYARRTVAANEHLLQIALTAGGEAGAHLANREGLPTSPDTLLRLLRRAPLPVVSAPRVLGIDDLALRRRHKYATIFVDLETHRPIDLVEGSDAETLANWLRAHPGAEVIARDRSEAYIEGIRMAAPEAVEVADRFHLLENASEALDGMLRGRRLRVEDIGSEPEQTPAMPPVESVDGTALLPLSPSKQYQAERRGARIARWEKVKALADLRVSIRQIAREVGISRKTVQRLLASPKPPHNRLRNPRPAGLRSPMLQPYVAYLQDRWEEGCTNVAQLLREIAARGYPGRRSLLTQAVEAWRPARPPPGERKWVRRLQRRLSMRWLCLLPPNQLKPHEKEWLQKLLAQDAELALGYKLLHQFREVVATREVTKLERWLEQAKASHLSLFVSLANGFEGNRAAVAAALTLPWSNGPTEGQINRLKLIKRQGYGRAKLDLLRARMLAG